MKNDQVNEGDWFDETLSEHRMPSACDEFKDELREGFLRGEFKDIQTCEAFRSELRDRFVEGKLKRKPLATKILRFAVPLAAAAVLMFAILPLGIGDSHNWEVLEVSSDASILGAIAEWQEVHTGNDRLRLGYGDEVFVEIGAGSLVERVLGEGPGKLNAKEGSLLFTALKGQDPITFFVETPDAVIQISSTSVGVDVYEGGTCVCVLEGNVVVTPRVGESESRSIGTGCSCFVETDGVLHFKNSVPDAHASPVRELKRFSEQ